MDFGVYTMGLVWVLKFTQRHKLQPVLVSYIIGSEIEINTGIKYQTSPVWYDISLVPAWYEYQLVLKRSWYQTKHWLQVTT